MLGLSAGLLLCLLSVRLLPHAVTKTLGLALVLPCALLSMGFPLGIHTHKIAFLSPFVPGFLGAPLTALPCSARYLSLPYGMTRAAVGLGATMFLRLQKLWLPLFLKPAILSCMLAMAMLFFHGPKI